MRVRQVNEEVGEYYWSGHQWIKDDQPSEPFSLTQVFSKPTFWSVSSLYICRPASYISCPKGLITFFSFSVFFDVDATQTITASGDDVYDCALADTVTRRVY